MNELELSLENSIDIIGRKWPDEVIDFIDKIPNWNGSVYKNKEFIFNMYLNVVQGHVYDYIKEPRSVLDFSCGSGVFLEILRAMGNKVHGTDEPNCGYSIYTNSSNISVTYHNGNNLPYPFDDKSYDLVTQINALDFLKPELWKDILYEYFRIARKNIFIRVNTDPVYYENENIINSLTPPNGWKLLYKKSSTYKWEYND